MTSESGKLRQGAALNRTNTRNKTMPNTPKLKTTEPDPEPQEHEAKRLGRQEYRIGRRYSENPYSRGSDHYDKWASGWTSERNGQ